MLGNQFYHSTTRKYVILFGNLFSGIKVTRFDADNKEVQTIPVPIRFGPIAKYLAILNNHPQDKPIAVELPRMGFEITSWSPDLPRKINPIHKLVNVYDDSNKMLAQFAPIPYKIGFELSIMTKFTDDAMQIVEQIIPYFNPDFNATMNLIPGLDYKYDIRVNLASISQQDVYDGQFQERRSIIWTLGFEVDAWYFGPVSQNGVIKRVQIDFHALGGMGQITAAEINQSSRSVRLVVKPGLTADGLPTSDPTLSIPYNQIDAEDDFGFIEEHYNFADGLKYNPVKGEDE